MTEYDMSSDHGNKRIIDSIGAVRGNRPTDSAVDARMQAHRYLDIDALSREDFLTEANRICDVLYTCPGGVSTLASCGFDDLRKAFNRLLTLADEAK